MKKSIIGFVLLILVFYTSNVEAFSCIQGGIGGQCVAYVRSQFGGNLSQMPGLCTNRHPNCEAIHAWTEWNLGHGKGSIPQSDSIIILNAWGSVTSGHMAVVTNSILNNDGTYMLSINDSNWSMDEKMDCATTYTFYPSTSQVTIAGGSTLYSVLGFIYSKPTIVDGVNIKFTNSPDIYYVFGNQLWRINDEQTFYGMGNSNFANVVSYDASRFNEITSKFPIAGTITGNTSTTPLFTYRWTYRVGHSFLRPVKSSEVAITYQSQNVSIAQAVANGWIYRKVAYYDYVRGMFMYVDINGFVFNPLVDYYFHSFVNGAKINFHGELLLGENQAVIDMDNVARLDSRIYFKELQTLEEFTKSWSASWTLRRMAYQVSANQKTWFNHATLNSNPAQRFVIFKDPVTGVWGSWRQVQ